MREEIELHKYYPRSAKKLHQTGIVEVVFLIRKDGTIEGLKVSTPCRYRRLNKAALKTVEKIGGFDPLPDVFESDTLTLKIPINFVLKR
ncbi:energy transducer TonB [Hydrogenimonas sp.]